MIQITLRDGRKQAFLASDIASVVQKGEKTAIVIKGDCEEFTLDADYAEVLSLWKLATVSTTVWGQ